MKHQLYLHEKTQSVYRVLYTAIIEADMITCVVYTDHPDNDHVWVRPHSEFFDGRFLAVGEWDDKIFNPLADIAAFHERFDLPAQFPMGALDKETARFRYKFLLEEMTEWWRNQAAAYDETTKRPLARDAAEYTHRLEEALDGLVDLAYVLFGTAYLHGFNDVFAEAWDRVHTANMQKVRASLIEDSSRGSTLDVVKPAGWEPPSHTDLVENNNIYSSHSDRS